MSNTCSPRKSSGSVGFTKGYLVVAGWVKMCDTALFNIGDMRGFAIFYTSSGYTHVTIDTVSINDNTAAGKIIFQFAEST